MPMFYSVESRTARSAVLAGDDGSRVALPPDKLDAAARPGDVVAPDEGGVYRPCPEETARRAAAARRHFAALRRRANKAK